MPLVTAAPMSAQTLERTPDLTGLMNAAPATPEQCYKLSIKRLIRSKQCACVKCGYHLYPPRQLCWKVC